MATKKTAKKSTKAKIAKKSAKGKAAKSVKAAPAKIPFFAKPGRLFGAATKGLLPKGSYANVVGPVPDLMTSTLIRVGTTKGCSFEGTLADLLTSALGTNKIKLKLSGAPIPSPAEPKVKAPAASPSL